jgi:RHS repeat-associated protein
VTTEVATTSALLGGAGDRLSQSVGGAVTTYTLDLYGGLTQVLGGGASVYLYGLGRIGEEGAAGWLTHLGDALGSVRQLAAGDGEVVLDRSYRPYGGVLESGGSGASAYGFAGEWTDGTGLVFLRARYLDPGVGRFVTLDPVTGSPDQPATLHRYLYAGQDPINRTDPTGLFYCSAPEAGCVRWVLDALEAIQSAGPRGSQLVQSFRAKDQDLKLLQSGLSGCYCVSPYLCSLLPTPADMPGLKVAFTDNFPPFQEEAAMSVWAFPENMIYVKLRYFDPPNKPSGDAILLFAHELVHIEQGNWLAFSILGEVLAYRTQAEFRLGSGALTDEERAAIDVPLPPDNYSWSQWQALSQGLRDWESQFPDYAMDPLFPLWDNPYPEPIGLYPRPQPERPPTPPASVPSPPEPPGTPTPP